MENLSSGIGFLDSPESLHTAPGNELFLRPWRLQCSSQQLNTTHSHFTYHLYWLEYISNVIKTKLSKKVFTEKSCFQWSNQNLFKSSFLYNWTEMSPLACATDTWLWMQTGKTESSETDGHTYGKNWKYRSKEKKLCWSPKWISLG